MGTLETSSFLWSSSDRIGRLEMVLMVWSSPKQAHSKPGGPDSYHLFGKSLGRIHTFLKPIS